MRLRVPSPRDGWRIFLGDVGVIVLGVLIALGAQEAVSEYNMRKDVNTFEAAIRKEIGYNLFSYEVREAQFACIDRNVQTMLSWLESVREGRVAGPIEEFAFPNTLIFFRSAWDTKDPDVFANIPSARKQLYSEFYDELKNNDQLSWEEIRAWMDLFRHSEPGPVSVEERREAAVQILQMRGYNNLFKNNYAGSRKIAASLGITPIRPDTVEPNMIANVKRCETLKMLKSK
jgi:hypothetical protein